MYPHGGKLVLEEAYATVLTDAGTPCIIVQQHGFANREQFKHMKNPGLEHFQAHTTPSGRAGLREMSIVTSENSIGQLATQPYAQLAVAQPETYLLEYVYYPSLKDAQLGVRKRAARLSAEH